MKKAGVVVRSIAKAFEDPTSVTKLALRGARIAEIPWRIRNLVNLEELDLSQTSVQTLPEDIGALSKLRVLRLSEANVFRTLPKAIGKCEALESLDLWGTRVERLPSELFDLRRLRSLRLGAMGKLVLEPGTIGKLPLRELDLYGFARGAIPADALAIETLVELRLGNTALTELPEAIGDLPDLATLALDGGAFTSLPASFANLRTLKTLDLARCSKLDLGKAFATLSMLPALASLDLGGSHPMRQWFEHIPLGLAGLAKLKKLSLRGNQLVDLPADLFVVETLEELDLSENVLRTLPADIGRLRRLKSLVLSFNRANPYIEGSTSIDLSQLFAQAKNLTRLKHLDLRWMSLETLPNAIADFPALRSLALGENEYSADAIAGLRALLPNVEVS